VISFNSLHLRSKQNKMKNLFLFVLIATSFIACKNSAASKVKEENVEKAKERDLKSVLLPIASFDKKIHDYGMITEGDVVSTSFVVTNTGKSDLLIRDAKATCGCTIPVWPKKPIPPGSSGKIEVKFNSRGKKNKQSKTITLTTNTIKGIETLVIKGQIMPKN
jgi:hypothetical protein